MKKGPYFANQQAYDCGCFYPDAMLLGVDGKGTMLLFCTRHGFSLKKRRRNKLNPEHTPFRLNKAPTEAWRNKERRRMSGAKRKFKRG